MKQAGFRIVEMSDLPANSPQFSWRVVHPFDFTIETHPNCPIDGTPLETIAALLSLTLPERVRIGACPRCGLVGYIDRPSQADIDKYYAETWMGQSVEEATEISVQISDSPPNAKSVELLKSLPIDRGMPVLEIGCGYGRTIHDLQWAGFVNIDATEHCPTRAQAVRGVFDIEVSTEIPQKRYGLIISHHVLEHVADPAGLIRACAARQQLGDHQWHTLPRFDGEPSMGVLFFLPHLWSFQFKPLADLFHGLGYLAAEDDKCGIGSLHVAARKDDSFIARLPYVRHPGYPQRAVDKLLCGLGLAPQRSILSWQKDSDGTAWKSLPYAQQAAVNNFPRSIVVEPHTDFVTDAPIEIAFPQKVQMFLK